MATLRLENRTGKVISLGRLTLSMFIFAAVFFGMDRTPAFPAASYRLAAGYMALAALFLALTWSSWWIEHRLKLFSHVVDVTFFLALSTSTGLDVSSPFFLFFVFLVLSAAAKWGWREAIATGLVAALLFAGEAAVELSRRTMAAEDYVRAIVRSGHLLVLSLMIAWFGLTRLSGERSLAIFFTVTDSIDPPIRQALAHLGECLGARTVGLVWWEADEPWFNLSRWTAEGIYEVARFGPDAVDAVVDERLEGRTFLFDIARGRALTPVEGKLQAIEGVVPLSPLLADRLALQSGLATPLKTEGMDGYFVAGLIDGLSWDDLAVARRAGIDIGRGFDRSAVLRSSIDSAEIRTRLSVARDLHDSVAQILAGIGLKLRAVRMRAAGEGQRDEELAGIEAELVQYQRDIHDLIENLRGPAGDALRVDLDAKLSGLAIWLQRHWNVEVEFTGDHLAAVSRGLESELSFLAREATANAVRHGGATRVRLSAERDGGDVVLRCADNGRGFAEHGRFSDDDLAEQGFGPRSILERVHYLGGSVELVSEADGAQVIMHMPAGTIEP